MGNVLLDAALKYHDAGYSIIPLRPGEKRPAIKWETYQRQRATRDQLTAWWKETPGANVGIVTGRISNLLVIDCDSPEAYQAVDEALGDSVTAPVASTPRGGRHVYFKYPEYSGLTVGSDPVRKIDWRGEGGYIVAAPSRNGNGTPYAWVSGDFNPPPLYPPPKVLNLLNAVVTNGEKDLTTPLQPPYKTLQTLQLLTSGRRDNDLFHIANCMIKGGLEPAYVYRTLEILASACDPPFDVSEIPTKVESAIKRSERRERNLKAEFLGWLTLQPPYWNLTDAVKTLQLLTKEERAHLDVIVHRLRKDGQIEKNGAIRGSYRTVQKETEEIDIFSADDNDLDIKYPLGIHTLVRTYPKNIIIVAGYPDSGKTAYLLNVARLNKGQHQVHYFSSEMSSQELRVRLGKFGSPLEYWKDVRWVERSDNFADVIVPDALNIIDFMEIHDEFWKVSAMLKAIHDKLSSGIAVIAMQKPEGRDLALGGSRGLEKPRLYLSMENHVLKIVKAKGWRSDVVNPNGMSIQYKIAAGCKISSDGDWVKP